jgi:energy-converting hydrogenase Eha subunit C
MKNKTVPEIFRLARVRAGLIALLVAILLLAVDAVGSLPNVISSACGVCSLLIFPW